MKVITKELDDTDKEIIRLAGEGKTAKETAAILKITINQVTGRIKEMMRYYECANKIELVIKVNKQQS